MVALLSPRPAAAMQRFLVEPENVMVVPGRAAVLGCRVENRAGECRYPSLFPERGEVFERESRFAGLFYSNQRSLFVH